MSPPDLNDLLSKAQQMQGRLADLQRELASRRFEGAAGGGMVTAVASGELRILEVRIEQGLLADGDRAGHVLVPVFTVGEITLVVGVDSLTVYFVSHAGLLSVC